LVVIGRRPPRRFPPPWSIEERPESFTIWDYRPSAGLLYFEDGYELKSLLPVPGKRRPHEKQMVV
jgi:hypothetical protein